MYTENSHPENKHAFYHLEICCRYVGEKFGHPVISEWTNRHYIKLSGVLSRQMNVQISPNTLKRIFGKLKTNERYFPQKVTRDTLARFAGYKDWDEFVEKHPRPSIEAKLPEPEKEMVHEVYNTPVIKKRFFRYTMLLTLISVLAIVMVMVWWVKFSTRTPVFEGVQLLCINPEGTNPHSAIFQLKLSRGFIGEADQFRLLFGDGKSSAIANPVKLITHYYEIPGRYYPVLFYKDVPVDTISVYLKTNGWTATANMQTDSTRVYPVNDLKTGAGKLLYLGTANLSRAGVDTNRTFFVHFVNTRVTEVSGDNFDLSCNLRTSDERPGVRCSQVNITVFGETSRQYLSLMKPGCASFNNLRFSENIISGETSDLRNLSHDLSGGGTVQLQVREKTGKLFINGRQVYQASYTKPLGKIYGIEILFSGIGEVFSMTLKDLKKGVTYDERLEPLTLGPGLRGE